MHLSYYRVSRQQKEDAIQFRVAKTSEVSQMEKVFLFLDHNRKLSKHEAVKG